MWKLTQIIQRTMDGGNKRRMHGSAMIEIMNICVLESISILFCTTDTYFVAWVRWWSFGMNVPNSRRFSS
jgi:hypothetical protein